MNFNEAIKSSAPVSGMAAFGTVVATPEYAAIPAGLYVARVASGGHALTRKGDDSYRVRFEVLEGEQAGATLLRVCTFSEKAIVYSQNFLGKLGLKTSADLLSPFPPAGREIICKLFVAIQRGDDGIERNDVKNFEVLRIEDSPTSKYELPPIAEGGAK